MSDQVLTSIELLVIELAQNEPPSSLVQPRSLVRRIFGGREPQPLGASRLEALRRYAILRRVRGARLTAIERTRLGEAGFDAPQIEEIDRLICAQGHAQPALPKPASPSHHDQHAQSERLHPDKLSSGHP